jgi:hypothetical protein
MQEVLNTPLAHGKLASGHPDRPHLYIWEVEHVCFWYRTNGRGETAGQMVDDEPRLPAHAAEVDKVLV